MAGLVLAQTGLPEGSRQPVALRCWSDAAVLPLIAMPLAIPVQLVARAQLGVLDGPRIVWKTILEHCQIVLPLSQPYPLTN